MFFLTATGSLPLRRNPFPVRAIGTRNFGLLVEWGNRFRLHPDYFFFRLAM